MGADMKDVFSLATFAIVALCFVVFVTTLKPVAIIAARAPGVGQCSAAPEGRSLIKQLTC
jgi:hypothetical protein